MAMLVVLPALFLFHRSSFGARIIANVRNAVCALPTRQFLIGVVVAGVVLRLIIAALYSGPQKADGETYFSLAAQLATGSYGGASIGHAYWPPGLPLFFLPFVLLFGPTLKVISIANLLLYLGTTWSTFRLAELVGGPTLARFSVLFLSFWPNLILLAPTATKELLLLFLLTTAVLTFAKGLAGSWGNFLATGILLGAAALTQPSLMLMPFVAAFAVLFLHGTLPKRLGSGLLIVVTAMLVILPWTIRNYVVLDSFVPVSTGGGDIFYRANNPIATGGYMDLGAVDLSGLDELEKSRRGFELGREWVTTHPIEFLRLSIYRQVLFLGDDGLGAYETIKRSLEIEGLEYALAKAVSNAYWLFMLACILMAGRALHRFSPVLLTLLTVPVLYFLAIDTVFEAGSRHHIPLTAILAILASALFLSSEERSGRANQT